MNMRIICTKENLAKGVNIVSKAVPVRTTMPILECILIDASQTEIRLLANDMEISIETVIEGTIEERGMVALEAKLFSELVRKLPDSDVVIICDETMNTLFQCEKTEIRIPGKSGEDFPQVMTIPRNEPAVISQFTLKEMIRQTIFSIADNENNRLMTGELFEMNNNHLRVVSLDGHRISIRNVEMKDSFGDHKVIVPGKTLMEISKILPGSVEEMVNIYFTDNHIVFVFDNTVVMSRLIEGEYFKIEQMLQSDFATKVVINKRELLESIDRSMLLVREKDKKPIIMHITEGNMDLSITSNIGTMQEDVAVSMEGKEIRIAFNPKFLLDALRVIDDENVTLYLINAKAPCFIKDERESYIYLVLPVNFKSEE